MLDMTPQTLQNGKYRIVRQLGQGGFGITYEGVQAGLNRRVAIKEFFMKAYCERDATTSYVRAVGTAGSRELVKRCREKFIKEAQTIARLESVPHIVRIHDIFEENGTAYYVMQYIGGGSLESLVRERGRLDERTAVGYIRQVGEALAELHRRRIMHLDIKPDNIMLHDGKAVLIDFGISKHYNDSGSATTTTPVGISKGYAPLEQYEEGGVQEFSPETDIYSLGAALYNLLTRQTPAEASRLLGDPLAFPSYVSAPCRNAITKAMQPGKKNRAHTVAEFLGLLQAASAGDDTVVDKPQPRPASKLQPTPQPTPKPQSRPTPKKNLAWLLLPLAVVGIIAAAIFNVYMKSRVAEPEFVAGEVATQSDVVSETITVNGVSFNGCDGRAGE